MSKIAFLILFLLSFGAVANDMAISFTDFLMLDRHQKIETIKMVQSFVVEYERKLVIDGRYEWPQQKKKYQVYKKFLSLIMSSAYAGADITKLSNGSENTNPNDLCLYGGWISSYYDSPTVGRKVCRNPSLNVLDDTRESLGADSQFDAFKLQFTDGNNIQLVETTAGGEASDSGLCDAATSILCNPAVFGKYKGKPLCVPNQSDRGQGTSFMCARAVEHIEQNDPEEYGKLLSGIISDAFATGVSGNQFSRTLEMMYDICLCGGDVTSNSFSHPVTTQNPIEVNHYAKYAQKNFSTRTCVGILRQTQSIVDGFRNACEAGIEISQNNEFLNLLGTLNRVDRVIGENLNQTYQRSMNQLNQRIEAGRKDNAVANAQYEQRVREDEELLSPLSQSMYQTAVERGLCPINDRALSIRLEKIAGENKLKATYIYGNEQLPSDFTVPRIEVVEPSNTEFQVTLSADNPAPPSAANSGNGGNQQTVFDFDYNQPARSLRVRAVGAHNGHPINSNAVEVDGHGAYANLEAKFENGLVHLKYVGVEDATWELTVPEQTNQVDGLNLSLISDSGEYLSPAQLAGINGPGAGNAGGQLGPQYVFAITQSECAPKEIQFRGKITDMSGKPRGENPDAAGFILSNPVTVSGGVKSLTIGGGTYRLANNQISGVIDTINYADNGCEDESDTDAEPIVKNISEILGDEGLKSSLTFKADENPIGNIDKESSPSEIYLPFDINSLTEEKNVTGHIAETSSEPISFKAVGLKCSFNKSKNSIELKPTLSPQIEGLELNAQSLDFSAATISFAKIVPADESSNSGFPLRALNFGLTEDSGVDLSSATVTGVKGIKLKIGEQSLNLNLDECKEADPVMIGSCKVNIKVKPASSPGGYSMAASVDEPDEAAEYRYEWYEMGKAPGRGQELTREVASSNESDSQSRMIGDDDNTDASADTDTQDIPEFATEWKEAREKYALITRNDDEIQIIVPMARDRSFKLIVVKDGQYCGEKNQTLRGPGPSNSSPFQMRGPGGVPPRWRITREGI